VNWLRTELTVTGILNILLWKEKTMREYRIMGSYQGRTEEIDTAETRKEANRLAAEYRMAFGAGWSIWVA
jgi:hypothetical protein